MRAQANGFKDKQLLNTLIEFLHISPSRLCLDECGDWMLKGREDNKIITDGVRWFVYIKLEGHARKWNNVKKRLAFMKIEQDGDDEGILSMLNWPSDEQAEILRKAVGFRKSTELSIEEVEALKIRFKSPCS